MRPINRKRSRSGKRLQHKFRFALASKKAHRREQKIVEFWDQIERPAVGRNPEWTPTRIEIARQIAPGRAPIQISTEDGEDEVGQPPRYRTSSERINKLKQFTTDAPAGRQLVIGIVYWSVTRKPFQPMHRLISASSARVVRIPIPSQSTAVPAKVPAPTRPCSASKKPVS
jgi:hypothetical protein